MCARRKIVRGLPCEVVAAPLLGPSGEGESDWAGEFPGPRSTQCGYPVANRPVGAGGQYRRERSIAGRQRERDPAVEVRAGDSACSNRDGAGGAESRCRCHALVQPLRSKMGRCRSSRAVSHEQPPLARVAFRTSAPRFERARTKRRRSRDDSSATGRARSRAYSAPTATPASAAVRNGRSPTHP